MHTPESPDWKPLYKIAAIAAFASIFLIPIQILFFIIWPLPTDVEGWFETFSQNWLRGLIGMDLLLAVQIVMVTVLYLALSVASFSNQRARVALGLTLGLLGATIYFPTNTGFEMLELSKQFARTNDPEIANQLLGAGRGALATFTGTAFNFYYILSAIALLLLSTALLKSPYFSRINAILGMAAGVLMLAPPTIGPIGMAMSFLSLAPWIAFMWLTGHAFMRLSR